MAPQGKYFSELHIPLPQPCLASLRDWWDLPTYLLKSTQRSELAHMTHSYFSTILKADTVTAIVTLTAITAGIVPAQRILKLNPDLSPIRIGRASKSVSKGLMSAEDNAWFDNPVMSREHAELVFDPEEMVCSDVRFLSTNLLILI
jgi:hypothetical protein